MLSSFNSNMTKNEGELPDLTLLFSRSEFYLFFITIKLRFELNFCDINNNV